MGVNWVPVAPKSHALSEPAGECETLLCSTTKNHRHPAVFFYIGKGESNWAQK